MSKLYSDGQADLSKKQYEVWENTPCIPHDRYQCRECIEIRLKRFHQEDHRFDPDRRVIEIKVPSPGSPSIRLSGFVSWMRGMWGEIEIR